MQQDSAEKSFKLVRSKESITQQTSRNPTQFPRIPYNQRFALTPESMGMNLRSDISKQNKQQIPHQEQPSLVEVKSYNERHNDNNSMLPQCRLESNESFHSTHSNTIRNSNESIKGDSMDQHKSHNFSNMTESSSPNVSPKTALQEWNFEYGLNNEFALLNAKLSSDNNEFMQTLKSAGEPSETGGLISYEQQLPKHKLGADILLDSSVKKNFHILNNFYAERIESINETVLEGKNLKICTYQEWVEMLTKINESFIQNMEELEREVEGRLNLVQKRVNSNCRHSQGNELMKSRKDIATLIKYIRNARNNNDWDMQSLTFETIPKCEIFGECETLSGEANEGEELKIYSDTDNNVQHKNKLYANMKALAHEVAEKHDEVRELKRQVISLEDEIQKAQKKIQLKDDVIKELRNDLKSANNKLSVDQLLDSNLVMQPINLEYVLGSNDTQIIDSTPAVSQANNDFQTENGSPFDSLSHTELVEQQQIKVLGEEILQYFDMNQHLNKQNIENQRKRIVETLAKQESEKAAAYRRLDLIRRQLIDLESNLSESNYDSDSGFHSKSENDQDAKLLEAVRKRLRSLNETNCELKKRVQRLEMDKNELSNNLETEKSFSGRNSEILKEIADLLCVLKGKQFSYIEMYKDNPNPFCEAIKEMHREFQELSQLLMNNEKDINEEFKDIDNTTTTTIPTTQLSTSSTQMPCIFFTGTEMLPTRPPTLSSTSASVLQLNKTTATPLQGLAKK